MKEFSIGAVLTVAHRKMLTDVDGIYEILNYMLDENLFTHQLSRALKFCAPFMVAQHPQIEEWGDYDKQVNENNHKEYLKKAVAMYGEKLSVEKVPAGVWTEKDPEEELEEMTGKTKIIKIKTK